MFSQGFSKANPHVWECLFPGENFFLQRWFRGQIRFRTNLWYKHVRRGSILIEIAWRLGLIVWHQEKHSTSVSLPYSRVTMELECEYWASSPEAITYSCVILGKLINFPVLHFHHLCNNNNNNNNNSGQCMSWFVWDSSLMFVIWL